MKCKIEQLIQKPKSYKKGLQKTYLYLSVNFNNKDSLLQALDEEYSISAYYTHNRKSPSLKIHQYYFVLKNKKETQMTCIKYYEHMYDYLKSKITARCTCKEKKPCKHIAYTLINFLKTEGQITNFKKLSQEELWNYQELLKASF